MRSQQQAERAEQQRIKNLVLNYELTDDNDGEPPAFHYIISPTSTRTRLVGKGSLNKSHKPVIFGGQSQQLHQPGDDRESSPYIHAASPFATIPSVDAPRKDSLTDKTGALETLHASTKSDKSGNTRSKQRARKLQLGDIDWSGSGSVPAPSIPAPPVQSSLDSYIVDKKQNNTAKQPRNLAGSWRSGGNSQQAPG